jgi:hypothetical protein
LLFLQPTGREQGAHGGRVSAHPNAHKIIVRFGQRQVVRTF